MAETRTMSLTEFLLARIAEDEAAVAGLMSGDGDPEFFWGPDRIRAECEAKRRIVEIAASVEETERALDIGSSEWAIGRASNNAEDILRALALPYADHPDWREEWRA